MEIDPRSLDKQDAYLMLTACVIPRPICWISTVDVAGVRNLAPFSFFGGVTTDPMTVMVSVGRKRGGRKDTAANLLATGEGVVHITPRRLAAAMVTSSANVTPEVDEFELAGLEALPATHVAAPRIGGAPIAMEVRTERHLEVGNGPVDLFLLEIVHLHLDPALLVDGRPDPAKVAAVGRLGGAGYCDTSAPFEIERP
jgi:flavin reductase (DIM6/NTAB) family NADH-FMN oxidoreductase RutF